MADEVIMDFGEWKTPRGWNELTLKQFQDIERYYSDKDKQFDVREVLNLFTDHSVEEISQLPIDFVDKLLNELSWLQDAPEYGEARPYIDINGERYQVNVMEKLKFGEYVSIDTILKADKYNYAAVLAVICRKEGEAYDSRFEAEVFEDRVKLFEAQPLMEVMPIVSFFLNLWLVLGKHSLLYSLVEEELNHIQQSIDNSEKIGAFRKCYIRWQMTKLRKLLKSNKNISQMHLHSSHTSSKKGKWKKKKILGKRIDAKQ